MSEEAEAVERGLGVTGVDFESEVEDAEGVEAPASDGGSARVAALKRRGVS